MCGILYANVINPIGNVDFGEIFHRALALMNYRGKDAQGFHQENNHYFGHVRLSILDLSTRSNQPVISANHVMLFNGEIYNFRAFNNHAPSDTIAISELVTEGKDLAVHLAGMYAILTYDRSSQEVRVLRDFYGEKPVYYYVDENLFLVASTIKSIAYIYEHYYHKKLNINHAALYDYLLCGYIREPKTIYEQVHVLSSGHELIYKNNGNLTIQNVTDKMVQSATLLPKEYAKCSFQTTDVEPAILLSSGVDSTYLLHLINQAQVKFNVFTYKSNIPEQDESAKALENMAKICKERNVKINIIENPEDIYSLYEKYAHIIEQPTSDGLQLYNLLSLSKALNSEIKLIVLGTGGDELYGGYHSFKNYNKISFFRKLRFLRHILPKKYQRFYRLRAHTDSEAESYYFLYRACPSFIPFIPERHLDQLFADFCHEMRKYKFLSKNALTTIKVCESFDYMRNQLLRDADNISLYCGYEARNPILSIHGYKQAIDGKKQMKDELLQAYGIQFLGKRGFTFSDDKVKVLEFLLKKISMHNDYYKVFSERVVQLLHKPSTDFNFVKKIFFLFSWLECNQINADQLQGFSV